MKIWFSQIRLASWKREIIYVSTDLKTSVHRLTAKPQSEKPVQLIHIVQEINALTQNIA